MKERNNINQIDNFEVISPELVFVFSLFLAESLGTAVELWQQNFSKLVKHIHKSKHGEIFQAQQKYCQKT